MIGATLKAARQARGLSLGALALRSGVSKATLSRWEARKTTPYAIELTRVMDALSLSPSQRQACWQSLDAPRAAVVAQNSVGAGTAPVSTGELLRALRHRSGVSQGDAARSVGVTQSMVSRWEAGECWPEGDKLHALCFVLGATAEELIFLTTRGWRQHEPLPDDKEALDSILDYLEYNDLSENRGLIYLTLGARYQSLYQKGRLSETDASDVWGRYAYYLCWRLRRYDDALRVVAPAVGSLKHTTQPLSRGQQEAVSALVEGYSYQKQGARALAVLYAIEGQVPARLRSWWLDFAGTAVNKLGQPHRAIAYQRQAVQMAPTAYERMRRQARLESLLCNHGQYKDALASVTSPERAVPQDALAHVGLSLERNIHMAWALAGIGERTEAQRYVERMLQQLAPYGNVPTPLGVIQHLINT